MTRRWILTTVAGAVAAAALAIGPASPASADGANTGSTPIAGGYSVSARVTFAGPAAPAGGARTMSVPATCWWEPYTGSGFDPTDPVAVEQWWQDTMPKINGTFAPARLGYGPAEMYEQAVAAAAAGQKLTFYHARCVDPDGLYDFNNGTAPAPPGWYNGTDPVMPITVGFFEPGNPPAPVVDPEALARVAYDAMVFPAPVVRRNPQIGGALAATLVHLPTWFWVANPASVGPGGTRWVRAQVGDVWSRVDAETKGLDVSSASSDAQLCAPERAVVAYGPGVAEDAACTLAFSRSSAGRPGGWGVSARVAWTGTWTSSTGAAGDGLAGRAAQTDVQVPVAESQALVGEVG